jgi:hypothetical protein
MTSEGMMFFSVGVGRLVESVFLVCLVCLVEGYFAAGSADFTDTHRWEEFKIPDSIVNIVVRR